MKFHNLIFALIIALSCYTAETNCQENYYTIQIKILNLKRTNVMLGHYYGNEMFIDDTTKLDSLGTGMFLGPVKLKKGMYFIYLPNKKHFDILIGDKQVFSILNDTFDLVNRFRCLNSQENDIFYNYQRYFIKKNFRVKELQDKVKNAANEKDKKDSREQLIALDKEVKIYIKQLIQQTQQFFFSTFLKATMEIEVPDFPRNEDGSVKDSLFQYKYYRAHYFDNFDFTNSDLLRTPIYERKFKLYFERIIPQIPDSIIPEVDMLINRARRDTEVFKYVLVTLFNYYSSNQVMGMEKVFYYIAEKYYIPEAVWSSREYIENLKAQIKKRKLH
jgi:hypothetical protein